MDEPVLVFKKKQTVNILSTVLFYTTFFTLFLFNIIIAGFSFMSLGFLCLVTIIPLFSIVRAKRSGFYVYNDRLVVNDRDASNGNGMYREIFFEEFCSIHCQSEVVSFLEPSSIRPGKQYYLVLTNKQEEFVFLIDFSFFQDKKQLEQFFLFLREQHPHITYDSRVRSILRGESVFPRVKKYTGLVFLILFNILWLYAIFHTK